MARDTTIIEYFGIPGCGKSTLCKSQKTGLSENVATSSDISKEMNCTGILSKIACIPWHVIIPILRLYVSFPFAGFRNFPFYRILIKKEFIYTFIKKYSNYNTVCIDHGMAQSVLGLVLCNINAYNQKIRDIVCDILSKSLSNKIVFCSVMPETAFSRMRNRKNHPLGRLEKIKDDKELINNLVVQNSLFRDLAACLSDKIPSKYSYLENDRDIDEI